METIVAYVTNEQHILMLLRILAIMTPLLGLAGGYICSRITHEKRYFISWGIIYGLSGPCILLLWHLYNAITEYLGLDTVKNLVVNIALFVILGIGIGLILSKAPKRKVKSS